MKLTSADLDSWRKQIEAMNHLDRADGHNVQRLALLDYAAELEAKINEYEKTHSLWAFLTKRIHELESAESDLMSLSGAVHRLLRCDTCGDQGWTVQNGEQESCDDCTVPIFRSHDLRNALRETGESSQRDWEAEAREDAEQLGEYVAEARGLRRRLASMEDIVLWARDDAEQHGGTPDGPCDCDLHGYLEALDRFPMPSTRIRAELAPTVIPEAQYIDLPNGMVAEFFPAAVPEPLPAERHPMQEIEYVGGTIRFRQNALVTYLLDNAGFDMNALALLRGIPAEDYEQFAQLIGYSVSGFGDLSYAREHIVAKADEIADEIRASMEEEL